MKKDTDLHEILKELSESIGESLSKDEVVDKLEYLQEKGFQLYLIMEPVDGNFTEGHNGPLMPIQVSKKKDKLRAAAKFNSDGTKRLAFSKEDRDFLKTLKIKAD